MIAETAISLLIIALIAGVVYWRVKNREHNEGYAEKPTPPDPNKPVWVKGRKVKDGSGSLPDDFVHLPKCGAPCGLGEEVGTMCAVELTQPDPVWAVYLTSCGGSGGFLPGEPPREHDQLRP